MVCIAVTLLNVTFNFGVPKMLRISWLAAEVHACVDLEIVS